MRTLVESLKRLYRTGKLTKEQIVERYEKGTITASEYLYITGELPSVVEPEEPTEEPVEEPVEEPESEEAGE